MMEAVACSMTALVPWVVTGCALASGGSPTRTESGNLPTFAELPDR